MQHVGVMNEAEIKAVVENIRIAKESSRDYLWPANKVGATGELELLLQSEGQLFKVEAAQPGDYGTRHFSTWKEAEKNADETRGRVAVQKGNASIKLSDKALTQLCEKAGFPIKYLRSLEDKGMQELAGHNITELMKRDKGRVLLRAFQSSDGMRVRAVLSNSYRTLDNFDLFVAATDIFKEVGADLWKARTWGDGAGFEVFAVSPNIKGQVRTDRPFFKGGGGHQINTMEGADPQNAAVKITNSETGHGGLNVHFSVMRQVCNNTSTFGKAISVVHLGRASQEDGLIVSKERAESESRTIWFKIRDAVRTAFDPAAFQAYINRLNELTQVEIGDRPIEKVKAALEPMRVTTERTDEIIAELLQSRDLSQYGLVQAATVQAHRFDKLGRHEAASEMEAIGSQMASMKPNLFRELINI